MAALGRWGWVWLLLALTGFYFAPHLRTYLDTSAPALPRVRLGQIHCTLGTTCMVHQGQQGLSLNLPSTMRTLTPYPLDLHLTGLTPQRVEAQLLMQGMEMHLPPTVFHPTASPTRWIATIILPVCSLGRSDWQMQITAQEATRQLQADFTFQLAAE